MKSGESSASRSSPTDRRIGTVEPSLAPARHVATDSDNPCLARPKVIPNVRVVALPVRVRHEHPDVAAQHFSRGVSEQPFARGVVEQHRPGRIDHDHAVERGVDDSAKLVLAEDVRRTGVACCRHRLRRTRHGRFRVSPRSRGPRARTGERWRLEADSPVEDVAVPSCRILPLYVSRLYVVGSGRSTCRRFALPALHDMVRVQSIVRAVENIGTDSLG